LETYDSLKSLLINYLKPDYKILILGCGNALFSEDMYDDGYKLQLNIDISEVVIKQMIERNKDLRPDLQWKVMDITDMSTLQS
jgi:SAM-dependent methyltransferase